MKKLGRFLDRSTGDIGLFIGQARGEGRLSLSEDAGKHLLAKFGVRVPKSIVVASADGVDSSVGGLTPPFVAKVMSRDILHKTEIGGVALNLPNAKAVRAAIEIMANRPEVKKARVDGYLVEEMFAPGCELVVGAILDQQFGPMIMVGLGGIFVEILQDVAFRLCPITRSDALEMLVELRGARFLDGARGQRAVNKEALIDLLLKVGGSEGVAITTGGEIAELDINPVIVNEDGAIAADARLILTDHRSSDPDVVDQSADERSIIARFEPLFNPQTVAVLGASASTTTIGNTFIRRMQAFGYAGNIYPIHPKASTIEGLPCYPSLAETPESIDYAYVAIGAQAVPDILGATRGRVRFAQVLSSGFGEVSDGMQLQADLVAKARAAGCRVLGPNCLGLYSPRGRVTFPEGASRDLGTVGIVSQSGGLGTDIIKRGQCRGIKFSGLVTIGNSADLGPVDLVQFYFADLQTKVVGVYLEDIKEGRRFFDLLCSNRANKPVVILRGGRSVQGRTAAASHTGALAGDGRAWEAMSKQTGCVMVDTVTQFIDVLLAFQFLELHARNPVRRVVLFGNGGGTSVLATDSFAERGLDVLPFEQDIQTKLESLGLAPGTSIVNPIDAPVATLQQEEGRIAYRILDVVLESAAPDAVVMHINLASFVGRSGIDPIDNLIQAVVQVRSTHSGSAFFLLVLRGDGSEELDKRKRHFRERALSVGIPVFDELDNAADALQAMSWVSCHSRNGVLDGSDITENIPVKRTHLASTIAN